jgi:hypothetical protein
MIRGRIGEAQQDMVSASAISLWQTGDPEFQQKSGD